MRDIEVYKRAIIDRLEYYQRVFPQRSAEYRQFKLQYSIPRLHEALRRIEAGTYGVCECCGDAISDERLTLVPGALFCVSCQTENEGKKNGRVSL